MRAHALSLNVANTVSGKVAIRQLRPAKLFRKGVEAMPAIAPRRAGINWSQRVPFEGVLHATLARSPSAQSFRLLATNIINARKSKARARALALVALLAAPGGLHGGGYLPADCGAVPRRAGLLAWRARRLRRGLLV